MSARVGAAVFAAAVFAAAVFAAAVFAAAVLADCAAPSGMVVARLFTGAVFDDVAAVAPAKKSASTAALDFRRSVDVGAVESLRDLVLCSSAGGSGDSDLFSSTSGSGDSGSCSLAGGSGDFGLFSSSSGLGDWVLGSTLSDVSGRKSTGTTVVAGLG